MLQQPALVNLDLAEDSEGLARTGCCKAHVPMKTMELVAEMSEVTSLPLFEEVLMASSLAGSVAQTASMSSGVLQ